MKEISWKAINMELDDIMNVMVAIIIVNGNMIKKLVELYFMMHHSIDDLDSSIQIKKLLSQINIILNSKIYTKMDQSNSLKLDIKEQKGSQQINLMAIKT